MLRIGSSRRNCQSSGLSNAVSEVLAAWILTFLIFGAGLSLLAFHERGLRAGVVVPGWRAPPVAVKEEWEDPNCRRDFMLCSDLPAEGNSADPVRVPSQSGTGL